MEQKPYEIKKLNILVSSIHNLFFETFNVHILKLLNPNTKIKCVSKTNL